MWLSLIKKSARQAGCTGGFFVGLLRYCLCQISETSTQWNTRWALVGFNEPPLCTCSALAECFHQSETAGQNTDDLNTVTFHWRVLRCGQDDLTLLLEKKSSLESPRSSNLTKERNQKRKAKGACSERRWPPEMFSCRGLRQFVLLQITIVSPIIESFGCCFYLHENK